MPYAKDLLTLQILLPHSTSVLETRRKNKLSCRSGDMKLVPLLARRAMLANTTHIQPPPVDPY